MLVRYLFLFCSIAISCKNRNNNCKINEVLYDNIDSIAIKLSIKNDTFNYEFINTPLFIINKSKPLDSVYCEYPIKHLIVFEKDDFQKLNTLLNKIEENEIWFFKKGVVLYIHKSKSNMYNVEYTILSTKKTMRLFESFGHKIKLVENCNNNWVKFTWESYAE